MASARRISGSASASRLVAWSNCARLLRRMATLGCSGPKLSRRWPAPGASSGSASAWRALAQNRLAQARSSAAPWARRCRPRRPASATAGRGGASGSSAGQVRTSCGSPTKAALTQPSACAQRRLPRLACQAAPGHVLHQPVDGEGRRVARRGSPASRAPGPPAPGARPRLSLWLVARDGNLQQRLRDRLRAPARPGARSSRRAGSLSWSTEVCQVTATLVGYCITRSSNHAEHLVAGWPATRARYCAKVSRCWPM